LFLHDHLDAVAAADTDALFAYLSATASDSVLRPDAAAHSPTAAVVRGFVPRRADDSSVDEPTAVAGNLKSYFEQLGFPVNLDTAIMQRAVLAYQRGETRGPALSAEYPATSPNGMSVIRQDFTAA